MPETDALQVSFIIDSHVSTSNHARKELSKSLALWREIATIAVNPASQPLQFYIRVSCELQ